MERIDNMDGLSKTGATMSDLKLLVGNTVRKDMLWYRNNTTMPYLAHRISGTLIIALSVSLPLIASLPYHVFPSFPNQIVTTKDLLVSLFGIAIAFFSALNSFYRWGDTWKANMRGMVELKNLIA